MQKTLRETKLTGFKVLKIINQSQNMTYSTFIFLEWICMILALASSFGWGNSIFLSNLPDRSKAGSSISTRFVAAMT